MRFLTLFVLTIASVLALGSALAAPERRERDTLNAKLFPLAVGHKWVYAFGEKEVMFEVLRTEKRDDITLYVVRRTIGQVQVDFKVAVEEDGVYIHQEGKKEFHPPLRQFAFFARTDDVWKWRGTVSGKLESYRFEHLGVQKVTVPAGTYSVVSIYQSNPETGEHATFWLAKDIGVVKVSGKTEVLADGPDKGPVLFEWTLKKFEPKSK